MPCDCGPDTRALWEKIRDFQQHHDQTADENQRLRKLVSELQNENDVLLRKMSKFIEAEK